MENAVYEVAQKLLLHTFAGMTEADAVRHVIQYGGWVLPRGMSRFDVADALVEITAYWALPEPKTYLVHGLAR